MLNYGTGAAQEAEPFHLKQTARHLTPVRSQAEQTYNPRVQGIGNEGHINSGILARSAQRQVLFDLPCLYTPVYIHLLIKRSP
jgi:hypothetical protein